VGNFAQLRDSFLLGGAGAIESLLAACGPAETDSASDLRKKETEAILQQIENQGTREIIDQFTGGFDIVRAVGEILYIDIFKGKGLPEAYKLNFTTDPNLNPEASNFSKSPGKWQRCIFRQHRLPLSS